MAGRDDSVCVCGCLCVVVCVLVMHRITNYLQTPRCSRRLGELRVGKDTQ